MIHINKKQEPEDLKALRVDDSGSHYYITEARPYLIEEQNELCAYCERRIERDSSHTEHLKPKSIYPDLKLDYKNLVASCNGFFLENESKAKETCGHRKDNSFDEDLFLDPTTVTNITDYFIYNKDTGEIFSNPNKSEYEQTQANHMIELLNLNYSPPSKNGHALPMARQKAKIALIETIKKSPKAEEDYKALLSELINVKTAFITFLQYCFSSYY